MKTRTSTLELEEITIDVIRKKIRNIHLRVYPPDGLVRISAPLQISDRTLHDFALSRLDWIRKQREKIAGRKQAAPLEYVSGETLYFEGDPYTLLVEYAEAKPSVSLQTDRILLTVRPGSSSEKKQSVFREWQRHELIKKVDPLIVSWSGIMKVAPSFRGIKRMKTKWGSCHTREGRIWLNLDLAAVSMECLEYVIVHELAHLLEPGHGPAFKRVMDRFLPDWKERKTLLNQSRH